MREVHRKPLIYVAGPYTIGVPAHNVRSAILAAEQVLFAGAIPFIPHLNHLWDLVAPHDYETWMEVDFSILERCDALLRVPGQSPGADREVEQARKHMPVFVWEPVSGVSGDMLRWIREFREESTK